MKRKLLSVLLTLCLAFSLLPTAALAEEPANVAKVDGVEYPTLAEAVAAVADGGTVTLLKSATGGAVGTFKGAKEGQIEAKSFTIDFGGYTYTVTNPAVGSTGYESQAFHLERSGSDDENHKVTFKNGTITTAENFGGRMLIQNYCDLTLENMTIIGDSKISYVISNNFGSLTAKGNTVIKAADGKVAFDLWYGMDKNGLYDNGVSVTFGTDFTGSVTGKIEYGAHSRVPSNSNWKDKARLTIANGNFATTFVDSNNNDGVAPEDFNITITGGTFTSDVSAYVPNGYIYNSETKTVEPLGETNAVAKVGENYYKTLAEAINAASDGATITLLKDAETTVELSFTNKAITLDLNGKTVSGTFTDNFSVIEAGADASLTVQDTSVAGTGKIASNRYGISARDGGALIVKSGTIESEYAPLSGNNTTGNMNFTVNGGTLTAKSGPAIYMPGQVSLTITDGVLNGGISLRMGQVNISGGTINAITTGIDMPTDTLNGKPAYAYSGNVWFPDALYVIGGTYTSTDTTYGNSLKMNITGGTFNCTNGKGSAVAIYDLGKVAQTANVTISGDAKFATNSAERNAYQVVSFADMGAEPIDGFDKTELVGKVSTTISGGYFTSDPSAYLAEGKGLVTSDQNAFAYKVGDKATDVETAVTAGEAAVTIPEGVTGITEDAVKNAAKAADTTKTLTDTVAATGMTNDPAVVGTKEAAEAALTEKGITVNSGETVTVVVQPYLEVNVKSADAGKLTLEISAKYNVVATTGSPVTIDPDKTATLKSGVPLSINKPIELTIVLPTVFATGNSKIYVQHKGYEYTATVDASGATATFINPHGFSTFTVTPTASAVAEVDGTSYTDLQKAVDAVANNGTVKLLNDTSASAVVSRAVKFTLDKNSKSFTGAITAGSGYELSVDGNVYTFTVRSSSGSSGSSSYDPTYSVSTPSKTEHGSVTVSPKSASKGDRVTVTVKPDSGYVLETLTVTDKNGNELTLKDKGNGKYTFTMPAGKVEVKATFMEDNSMLNFFYDVPNNAYFYEAVKWAVENGITTGVGNDLFAPEQPCTRAQIVTFLWRAAGSPEPKGAASGMTDVVSGSYYEKAVAWAIENGITTGTTTTTFSPDVTCTRAQAVTFLARALNAKAASAAEFSDVPTGSYFADAVAWAAANGVTEGIGGGLFGSDNDCTRGQIVTFLYRAYNK